MRISDWSSDVCSSDLTHLRAHAEAIGALVEVLLDFRLRRIRTRPIGIGRKRKTVQAGRNIAGGTGIAIRLPGATEACCLFEQHKTMSGLAQADRHEQTGKPRADDPDVKLRNFRFGRSGVGHTGRWVLTGDGTNTARGKSGSGRVMLGGR